MATEDNIKATRRTAENGVELEKIVNKSGLNYEGVISEGIKAFQEYMIKKIEDEKHSSEIGMELEKQELQIIDKMDKREKIFKGILIVVCLVSLICVALFLTESSQAIIPVISLIIGLLFRSSSVSDFLSFKKSSKNFIE